MLITLQPTSSPLACHLTHSHHSPHVTSPYDTVLACKHPSRPRRTNTAKHSLPPSRLLRAPLHNRFPLHNAHNAHKPARPGPLRTNHRLLKHHTLAAKTSPIESQADATLGMRGVQDGVYARRCTVRSRGGYGVLIGSA